MTDPTLIEPTRATPIVRTSLLTAPAPAAAPRGASPTLNLALPALSSHVLAVAGAEGLALASLLEQKGPLSDLDLIAAFPQQKPSHVRRALYRLQDGHVAQYVKDTDGAGWDTFLWHLCLEDVRDTLARREQEELEQTRQRLAQRTGAPDFGCALHHRRLPFEAAMDARFRCPQCNNPLQASTEGAAPAVWLQPIGVEA